jgi:hypothetical protein
MQEEGGVSVGVIDINLRLSHNLRMLDQRFNHNMTLNLRLNLRPTLRFNLKLTLSMMSWRRS